MRNKKGAFGFKKKITSLALAAIMLAGTAVPASAATIRFEFTRSGNNYGIKTTSTNYSSYVTSWAKVTDKKSGKSTYNSMRAYKNSSASATRTISNVNNVYRAGGAY